MRALVVVGHPAPGSFSHALADSVRRCWQEHGCVVTLRDLAAEGFDPSLTAGEARGEPTTDPLVREHIELLRSSDLLAVVHPNCWGGPPALMKGWVDRVFAPDAAYSFPKGSDQGDVPVGLLPVRAALVVNTSNTPPDREAAVFGDPLDRMWRDCVLRYCGVPTVLRALFAVIATSTPTQRRQWLTEAGDLARRAAEAAAAS